MTFLMHFIAGKMSNVKVMAAICQSGEKSGFSQGYIVVVLRYVHCKYGFDHYLVLISPKLYQFLFESSWIMAAIS